MKNNTACAFAARGKKSRERSRSAPKTDAGHSDPTPQTVDALMKSICRGRRRGDQGVWKEHKSLWL